MHSAKRTLQADSLGIQVDLIPSGQQAGTVLKQWPSSGDAVSPGAVVRVRVAKTFPMVPVVWLRSLTAGG